MLINKVLRARSRSAGARSEGTSAPLVLDTRPVGWPHLGKAESEPLMITNEAVNLLKINTLHFWGGAKAVNLLKTSNIFEVSRQLI